MLPHPTVQLVEGFPGHGEQFVEVAEGVGAFGNAHAVGFACGNFVRQLHPLQMFVVGDAQFVEHFGESLRAAFGGGATVEPGIGKLGFEFAELVINALGQCPIFAYRRRDPHRQVSTILQASDGGVDVVGTTVLGSVTHVSGEGNAFM